MYPYLDASFLQSLHVAHARLEGEVGVGAVADPRPGGAQQLHLRSGQVDAVGEDSAGAQQPAPARGGA